MTEKPDLLIVTGAGRGIGKAVALGLAADGVPVLAVSKTDTCRATAEAIRAAGGRAEALPLDLADPDAVQAGIAAHLAQARPRRIALVLAGARLGAAGGLAETELADWDEVFRVNVLGNLAVVKAALPTMLDSGYGRTVCFAGGGAAYAYPEFSAYACSKAAMVRQVENLGAQYPALTFVALAPGAVETDTLAAVRAAGGYVKTVASADETVGFVRAVLARDPSRLSGRFVHVRDVWAEHLDPEGKELSATHWKLRRVE